MRLIRLADLTPRPWKNGGGVTVEYLVSPANAGLDAFDWRVSRAEVAADGPFSLFAGIDRTLTVVDGAGIDLVIADRTVRLDPGCAPLAFAGDVPVASRLVTGPIRDLNVMSRRGRFAHRVERLALPAGIEPPGSGAARLIVALGAVEATSAGRAERLAPGDMIVAGGERMFFGSPASGSVLLIEIMPT
ncbi:MAG: HutD family protein [Ancalomicrobiaceae bacterium]|nr:HutD family protein [Ancalomicrobiaceae bacterium]